MKKNLKMEEKLSCDSFSSYRREYIKKWIEIHSNDQKKKESRPTNYSSAERASVAAKLVKTAREIPFQDTCAWK